MDHEPTAHRNDGHRHFCPSRPSRPCSANPAVEVVGLVTQPDRDCRAAARQYRARPGRGIEDHCRQERGVRGLTSPSSVNTPEGVAATASRWHPDLLVVAAYGQILNKRGAGSRAAWGGINVHASLLPKFRGAAPDRLGDLSRRDADRRDHHPHDHRCSTPATCSLKRRSTSCPTRRPVNWSLGLAPVGANLAVRHRRRRIAAGPVPGEKQDAAKVTRRAEIEERRRANRLVEISGTSRAAGAGHAAVADGRIHTRVTPTKRCRPTVQRALVAANRRARRPDHTPGSLMVERDHLFVATTMGSVEILELQPAGKKRMTAAPSPAAAHPIHTDDHSLARRRAACGLATSPASGSPCWTWCCFRPLLRIPFLLKSFPFQSGRPLRKSGSLGRFTLRIHILLVLVRERGSGRSTLLEAIAPSPAHLNPTKVGSRNFRFLKHSRAIAFASSTVILRVRVQEIDPAAARRLLLSGPRVFTTWRPRSNDWTRKVADRRSGRHMVTSPCTPNRTVSHFSRFSRTASTAPACICSTSRKPRCRRRGR